MALPPAPPETYLRWIEWWRAGRQYADGVAAVAGGAHAGPADDPALALLDFEAPAKVEAVAREALSAGVPAIAPSLTVDLAVAREARQRRLERERWLGRLRPGSLPPVDAEMERLKQRTEEVSREALGLD